MLDCPVCARAQIAGDTCPQCGADLKPLIRLAELRAESQKPPPEKRRPPFAAAAMFAAGLAVFPTWRALRPSPPPVAIKPEKEPLPPVAPSPETLYTARPGDSFWSIAREKYGMGEMWKTIRDDNRDRLRKPGRLQAGEQIRLRTVTISPK